MQMTDGNGTTMAMADDGRCQMALLGRYRYGKCKYSKWHWVYIGHSAFGTRHSASPTPSQTQTQMGQGTNGAGFCFCLFLLSKPQTPTPTSTKTKTNNNNIQPNLAITREISQQPGRSTLAESNAF
jgi:hypothetical protein